MRLGTYFFTGLIFIVIATGVTYFFYPGYHSITLMGITLRLPVAVWIAIPLLLLFLLTLLHMAYHGSRDYFQRRKWIRDAQELQDALYWSLLREPKEHHYSMPQMKEGAPLLNVSQLYVVGNVHGLSDKLMQSIEWVKKIESGEYVDLKSKKVERFLSKENPLVVRNQLNRIDADPKFAEEVLQARESYDPAVAAKALDTLVARQDLYKLKRFLPMMEKRHFYQLLERVDRKEDIGFTSAMAEVFAKNFSLECPDFIRLLQTALRRFKPDENLALFKKLAKEKEEAQSAYLYLLFEYEMLDEAEKFLEEHDENEFKPFRALLILKREKHHFRIDDLIDPDIACR
ncbi:hypothetical protein [Nitratifractor salsuginis]|uniref:HemY domain protein n=1 Tax=Nitratifractor salsuginis (strain DSM 16511 / JCM 12458 / E9I37-1) TaxID=749222 RepID=E6X2P1_NITSE|nr:hypothetical protein [Nitratifractor salsuginis]ADV46107.1 hypothetical protein Nitsa_0846 [Nitratifractor salsuginis DSM 16511]